MTKFIVVAHWNDMYTEIHEFDSLKSALKLAKFIIKVGDGDPWHLDRLRIFQTSNCLDLEDIKEAVKDIDEADKKEQDGKDDVCIQNKE